MSERTYEENKRNALAAFGARIVIRDAMPAIPTDLTISVGDCDGMMVMNYMRNLIRNADGSQRVTTLCAARLKTLERLARQSAPRVAHRALRAPRFALSVPSPAQAKLLDAIAKGTKAAPYTMGGIGDIRNAYKIVAKTKEVCMSQSISAADASVYNDILAGSSGVYAINYPQFVYRLYDVVCGMHPDRNVNLYLAYSLYQAIFAHGDADDCVSYPVKFIAGVIPPIYRFLERAVCTLDFMLEAYEALIA